MATTNDSRDPPTAEPGKQRAGADLGGMSRSADAGLADATRRSQERADEQPAAREAKPRVAASRPAGAPASRDATTAEGFGDDDEPWRHAPVAPRDEGPLKSLGRSVSDAVTGSVDDTPAKPKA
jgi:hypothetical protein